MKRAGVVLAFSGVLVAGTSVGPLGARGMMAASPAATSTLLAAGATDAIQPDLDPKIVALLNAISEDRLRQIIEKLTSFGTRNTLSAAESTTHGIGAARQWIFDELKRSSPKLQVSFDTHQIPQGGRITRPVELRNVIAILPGKSPRRIYVQGHYDSLNLGERGQQGYNSRTRPTAGAQGTAGAVAGAPTGAPATGAAAPAPAGIPAAGTTPLPTDYEVVAPGANDDGSGTALTMELARVFAESGIEFDATLVFITV